jgi:hypothetical protein
MRTLHGWVENSRAAHPEVFAVEINGLPAQHALVDRQELCGRRIASVMVEKDPIPLGLAGVASGDNVEQDAAARQAVQSCRHARRSRGSDDARANRHEKTKLLGQRRERSGDDPGVFTRAARGQKDARKAKGICRASNLLHVGEVDGPRAVRGAEVTTVAVGGNEP